MHRRTRTIITSLAIGTMAVGATIPALSFTGGVSLTSGNRLELAQQDMESGVGGWAANANSSIVVHDAGFSGSRSLQLTASQAGYADVKTAWGRGARPVVAGQVYQLRARWRTLGASRQVSAATISWRDASGRVLSQSTANLTAPVALSSSWAEALYANVRAPAHAATAEIVLGVHGNAAGDRHLIDFVRFTPAAPPALVSGNRLDLAQQDMENGVGGWQPNANASVVVHHFASTGASSLQMTADADGYADVKTAWRRNAQPIVAGEGYHLRARWMTISAARRLSAATINWVGTDGRLLSQSTAELASPVTLSLQWQEAVYREVKAPAGAVSAEVVLGVLGNRRGESHLIDHVRFTPAGAATAPTTASPAAPGTAAPAPTTTAPAPTTTTPPPTTTTTVPAPAPVTQTRDAALWPFTRTSPWNMPIGSGASYQRATDAATANLIDGRFTPWLNFDQYSHPVYFASSSDPWATFTRPDGRAGPWSLNVPSSARPAAGGDQHLHVVSPDRRFLHESWLTEGANPRWTTGHLVRTDLRGTGIGSRPGVSEGVRAYGGSAIGGLIRKHEIANRHIPHAIAMAMTTAQLRKGYVWPATIEDGGGNNKYHGQVPMGSLVAIPPSVNINALGLSADGLALARALQDYGGYATDQAGAFIMAFVEPGADSARVGAMRADLGKIRSHLRVVTNNTPTSVGGGGTPRAPLAPGF
jgi:hypothetical protein